MTKKFRVGILGATGMVGQRFIQLLENHPQFEISALAASDRSQGKTFQEACTWRLAGEMPPAVKAMVVAAPEPPLDCELVFSSLPGDIARESEAGLRARFSVISNSSAFRMDHDVPLLIRSESWTSRFVAVHRIRRHIVTNQIARPSCWHLRSPSAQTFGVTSVIATTMQALSGAGCPGSLRSPSVTMFCLRGRRRRLSRRH